MGLCDLLGVFRGLHAGIHQLRIGPVRGAIAKLHRPVAGVAELAIVREHKISDPGSDFGAEAGTVEHTVVAYAGL